MNFGAAIMGLETCLAFFFARSTMTKAWRERSSRNSLEGKLSDRLIKLSRLAVGTEGKLQGDGRLHRHIGSLRARRQQTTSPTRSLGRGGHDRATKTATTLPRDKLGCCETLDHYKLYIRLAAAYRRRCGGGDRAAE